MNILIIFETVEGQTGKVAKFVDNTLTSLGHTTQLYDVRNESVPASFEGVDKVVLAAPVHERRHPKDFEALVAANLADLSTRETLLLSISLKAAFPEGLEEAQDYLTEMKMRTQFTPTQDLLVAGAVRQSSYGYFESQIVRHVVLAGQDVELIDGAREFTDWDALKNALGAFAPAKAA